MHGLIVPVLLSDRSRSGHVRAPHDCLQGLHKARAESALQGRNTRWQGHSEISGPPGWWEGRGGASLPVNRGTHSPAHVGRGLLGLLEPF